jgi:GST-like protein
VRTWKWSGVAIDGLPQLSRWIGQIADRPACQRGLERPPGAVRSDDDDMANRFAEAARKMVEFGKPAGHSR